MHLEPQANPTQLCLWEPPRGAQHWEGAPLRWCQAIFRADHPHPHLVGLPASLTCYSQAFEGTRAHPVFFCCDSCHLSLLSYPTIKEGMEGRWSLKVGLLGYMSPHPTESTVLEVGSNPGYRERRRCPTDISFSFLPT